MDHLSGNLSAAFKLEPFSPLDNLLEALTVLEPILAVAFLLFWLPQKLLSRYEAEHGPVSTEWIDFLFSPEKSLFALLIVLPLIMVWASQGCEDFLREIWVNPPRNGEEISMLPPFVRGIYIAFGYYGVSLFIWFAHAAGLIGWLVAAKHQLRRWLSHGKVSHSS